MVREYLDPFDTSIMSELVSERFEIFEIIGISWHEDIAEPCLFFDTFEIMEHLKGIDIANAREMNVCCIIDMFHIEEDEIGNIEKFPDIIAHHMAIGIERCMNTMLFESGKKLC